ncbi:MAG: GNAT family N-acetyltransferase [Ornithinimicrobium sp.]
MSEPHGHTHDHDNHDDHAHHDHRPLADASVRTGRANDAPAIGAVQATVFRSVYAQVVPDSVRGQFDPDQFASVWRRSMTNPPSAAHRVMVACAGEQVVGFAALGPTSDTDEAVPDRCGEIMVLAIHADARRSGHGSRLLNACGDTLRANDCAAVLTWVLAQDEETRAFCSVSGLTPDGAWRERVVGPHGETAREVRLVASL